MTDTTISDAVCFPQDDGTGVTDGSEDYNSAGFLALLSKYSGDGSYVGEDTTGAATLQFANVDTTNEQVDVQSGYAYISEASNTVQSGSQTTYDTTLPVDMPYVVILPSTVVDLGLGTDTSNDLWLAVDPTANDSVYIRHGDGLSAPTDPSVKLGTVDTSDGSTTRANDLRTASFASVNTEQQSIDQAAAKLTVADESDVVTVPNNTTTKIPYNQVSHEPSKTDVFDTDPSNNEITVNKDGEYSLKAKMTFASDSGWSTGDTASWRVFVNGSREFLVNRLKIGTASQTFLFFVDVELAAGDTLHLSVNQNSGSGKDLFTDSGSASEQFEFALGRWG